MAVSNDTIRNNLNDYALITAYSAFTVWRNLLARATSLAELQASARQYLPQVLITNADSVGGYALNQYVADRSESSFASSNDFIPTQTQILGKVNRVVNTITDWDLDAFVETELSEIDWEAFEKELRIESAQIAYDKYKSIMQENGAQDTLVTHLQIYVRPNACAFCCMVAAGSSGRRRVRTVRSSPVSQGGRNNERQINSRARDNALEFATDGFYAQETPAHIHTNCHCVYRPVFQGGVSYDDPASNARLVEFEKTYYDTIENTDLRSTDRNQLLSQITKSGF